MGVRGFRLFATATVVAAGLVGGGLAAVPAGAAPLAAAVPVTAGLPGAAPVEAAAAAAVPSRPRWYRETVKYGARDTSPYQISHVYELQIRLYRAGTYRGPITGYFGAQTLTAVKLFQKGQKFAQTGVVDQATWTKLIWISTLRSQPWYQLPAVCKSAGFHTCYSRYSFELFLMYNGTLWNSWLVRGGAQGLQTVTGTYRVYWQDVDHKSSAFNNAPMPYSQFFYGGEAVHGSATMMDPRIGHSHGCINMYIEDAADLWKMTAGRANTVTVYGSWR
jgi:lipoprotein-anchoring transpeptidase ErfK/SrfK